MANRVKELREKTGLTLNDFATRLNVNSTTVYKWESTGNLPRTKAVRICNEFGCNIDWLLNNEGETTSVTTNDVGKRIQEIRGHYGWKLAKMGSLLGVTINTIKYWENVGHIPEHRLHAIAEKCNVNYEWLTTGKGKMFDDNEKPSKLGTPKDVAIMYGFDHGTAAAIERYVNLPPTLRETFAETLAYILLDRPMSISIQEKAELDKIHGIPR